MSSFYTNVQRYGSKILYRGIKNGQRLQQKVGYSPTLFLRSDQPTKFTTIHGQYVAPIKPGTMVDCRKFLETYQNIQNFEVYGYTRYEYAFISDLFPKTIQWNRADILVANLDIEVGSDDTTGFPEPEQANCPITAITIKIENSFKVFGCGNFTNTRSDVQYIKCQDEIDLIKRFLHTWTSNYPDVITGWHIKFFDLPYLVNRITKLLGKKVAKTLSPWGMINERSVFQHNKKLQAFIILGIATLDYIELYKKFAPKGQQQESYKLDYICSVEINAKKLSYDEYGSLHRLYKENYQKFIEYNIKDVELVDKLDEKLKLIDLALTLSYDNKCNYEDVFAQVRMWDVIIFNHLRTKKMVVPQIQDRSKDAYVGAYVKEPQIGMFKWVASYDVSSLYPHLIMQFNISPETLIEPENYTSVHNNILSQTIGIDQMLAQSVDTTGLVNCSLTPNGQFFSNEKQGILPELMEKMFKERDAYKKKMKDAKRTKEAETDPIKKEELDKTISRYDNLQLGKKLSLNSCYGAVGNNFFRYYDPRQASAITTSGQLTIRWVEKHLNKYLNSVLKTKDVDYVIYADTDSNYLNLDALVSKALGSKIDQDTKSTIRFMDKVCEKHIQPAIDKSFVELARYTNAFAQKLTMKREALVDRAIFTGKKRYILNVYDNEGIEYAKPEVKITGMEMIKSTTPQVIREKLKEAVDVILSKDEHTIQSFIVDFKEQFKKMNPADIASASGVNGVSTYTDKKTGSFTKGTPMHVRGCIIYNSAIKAKGLDKKYPLIGDGEKIKFIALKEPNYYNSDTISFQQDIPKELDLEVYIDYDAQYDKVFVEPLRRILSAIGWKTEQTSSLEDWFA